MKSVWRVLISSAMATVLLCSPAWAQKRGGTMVMAVAGEPSAIVGFLHSDTGGFVVASNIFSGLIGMDFNYNPTPNLAERWDISPDGLAYMFHLYKTAKFHDGKPVTAHDVEYTFNEAVAKYHPSRGSWWPNVESAKAIDDHTFRFQLKQPSPAFLINLAYELRSGGLILPKHLYAGTDPSRNPFNDKPIGSGPFKVVKWVKGSHVELERHASFHLSGRPYLDRLIIQFVPDPATRILAFERGDIDFIDSTAVPHNELKRLSRDARFKIMSGRDAIGVLGMLLINVRRPALQDVRVRQAIAYALDVDDISDKALFSAGRGPRSVVASNQGWAFTDKYFAYKRDVAKANAMLDDAGVPRGADGTRFKLSVAWTAGRSYDGKAAELIRDQLRDVGIAVDVRVFDRPSFIQKVFADWDFDAAVQLISTGPDPSISVATRFHTKQINRAPFTNGMGYSNPQLDDIFDRDAAELDRSRRQAYWDEAQKILMRDLPAIPLFELPDGHLANAKLENIANGPFGYFESRHEAYFR